MKTPTPRRASLLLAAALWLLPAPPRAEAQTFEDMAVMAIELEQEDLLRKAIERGANPNAVVGEHTLLGHAIALGTPSMVGELLRRGAEVNRPTGKPAVSPLELALRTERRDYDFSDMAVLLLRSGADARAGQNALARAALGLPSHTLFQAAISAGVSPNDEVAGGGSIFARALSNLAGTTREQLSGCADRGTHVAILTRIVRSAISEQADLRRPVAAGSGGPASPPLFFALRAGLFDVAEAIIARGVDPRDAGPGNTRPLQVTREWQLPQATACAGFQGGEPAWRAEARAGKEAEQALTQVRLLRLLLQVP